MGLAWFVVQDHLPKSLDPSVYGQVRMPTSIVCKFILGVWPRWDAVHHLNLAMEGYFASSPGDSVFYPLYATLTRFLAFDLGERYIIAGLLLSTISTVAAFMILFLLGDHIFGEETGKWAAISLAVYPTAVFLVAPFTESLFLALTLAVIYLSYRDRWWTAAASAFLVSLTRGPGLFLALPLIILAGRQWYPNHRPTRTQAISHLAAIAAPLVGGISFLAWRNHAGFPSMTETLRQYTGTTFVDPVTGIITALRQWITVLDLPTTLDILSVLLFITITIVMVINPRWRRTELLVYMFVNIGFFLSRRTESAASLKSMSRYVLVLFPAFLIAGDYLKHARSVTRFLYLILSSSLLIILTALYPLWFFLG